MSYDFDLFVIGAGSGGIATARRAAEYGAKVGIAEYSRLGGTCVNRGCVPKKLMVYASHFPAQFEEAQGYGWSPVETSFDWSKMIAAVNNQVDKLNGIYQNMLDKSGVQVFRTHGKFVDSHTVEVGDKKVTAERILIAVGGKPDKPDIPGMEYAITSDAMFHLEEQPKRMVIIGSGYIGIEFACILNGLGSQVTLINRGDKILRGFDEDIRTEINEGMIEHGIEIINNQQTKEIRKTQSGLQLINQDGEVIVSADAITLAATGRIPNLENLGLENTGVETNNGAIAVNKYNQTTEEHIFAVGDCTDNINLTPVAIREGRAFADSYFGSKSWQMSYDNVPTAIFSYPEAATVGLTESEAKERHGEDGIKIYRTKFRSMYYCLPDKQEKVLMKLVVEKATDRVLGAHMVGDCAAEIIQGVAIAVQMGATKADFDATVAIHPSIAEEFVTMR